MRQLGFAAATVAIAALFAAAPASAERINGGPVKQNGQCWKQQRHSEAGTWGYWQPCAEKAGNDSGAAQQPNRRKRV
jgi:hypothetical protein